MKRQLACLSLLAILVLLPASSRRHAPRNIIIMIGDGMGLTQITAGHTVKGSLALEEFDRIGLVLTQAHGDDYITDSAASATAMATGVLSYNGAIGVGPDGEPRETVMEVAERGGRRTGLVASCSITHATPACFVSHVPSRSMQVQIAEQMAECGAEVLLGSGWGWFKPESEGGRRTDGRDLVGEMRNGGYTYVSTGAEFDAVDRRHTDRLVGLFDENHCGPVQERAVSLPDMTRAAIDVLSGSRRGFVLMVEGSQIDWAGHANEAQQVALEMVDFDDAVAAVLDFARKRRDTLVIVTADHETGGFAIVDGSVERREITGEFVNDSHTGTMIPIFAMGPGSERFGGIMTVADIGQKLLDLVR